MELGMIGLGCMGTNMAQRPAKGGHDCVVCDVLPERFSLRGDADSANRVLSAMRHGFGGYVEKPADEP